MKELVAKIGDILALPEDYTITGIEHKIGSSMVRLYYEGSGEFRQHKMLNGTGDGVEIFSLPTECYHIRLVPVPKTEFKLYVGSLVELPPLVVYNIYYDRGSIKLTVWHEEGAKTKRYSVCLGKDSPVFCESDIYIKHGETHIVLRPL